jgi:hypothetical protein
MSELERLLSPGRLLRPSCDYDALPKNHF